jgi:glutamine cyclotransferase
MKTRSVILLALALLTMFPLTIASVTASAQILIDPADVWGYRVVADYPHDDAAYTQGLDIHEGVLYEGTGLYGESRLRRVDLESGDVEQEVSLDNQYFGEGIVVVDDRIFQLTWKEHTALVYDRETFEVVGTFSYDTEGWGLTHDGDHLVMSDGSDKITFRDARTFEETSSINVTYQGAPVTLLNELEYIDGEIWANVYTTDFVVRIDPQSGEVKGWIDFSGLLTDDEREALGPGEVLNGIAQDPDTGKLYVTGKMWPRLYEIELVMSHDH